MTASGISTYTPCSLNFNPQHLTGFLRKKKRWKRHRLWLKVLPKVNCTEDSKCFYLRLVLNQARRSPRISFPLEMFHCSLGLMQIFTPALMPKGFLFVLNKTTWDFTMFSGGWFASNWFGKSGMWKYLQTSSTYSRLGGKSLPPVHVVCLIKSTTQKKLKSSFPRHFFQCSFCCSAP